MIKFLDLQKVTAKNANEIHEVVNRVIDIGWILQGKENEKFEPDYANFFDTKYAVGCANGLDALIWIFRAYFASILVITENGLVPILVELKIDTLEIDGDKIESLITKKTKAISIVHLDGRYTYTEKIGAICKKYNLKLIEDIAQVLGCMAKDSRRTGSLGDAGGHPFYPGKNLRAFGDAVAVTTNDKELTNQITTSVNYGSQKKYFYKYCVGNSRLDEVHAAVLDVKLHHLDDDNEWRMKVA